MAIGASSTGLHYSFAVRTVSDWNQLPAVVVEQENPAAFKAQLARCAPVRIVVVVLVLNAGLLTSMFSSS